MVLASWVSALLRGVSVAAALLAIAALLRWGAARRRAKEKGAGRVLRACSVALLALGCAAVAWAGVSAVGSIADRRPVPAEALPYLTESAHEINLSDDVIVPEAFGDIDSYRVFLAGEYHTLAKSYAAKKLMVRSLYEHAGVRYLLVESGFGAGLLLEHYVQAGDEALLDAEEAARKGTLSYNRETRDFWTWLRGFNAGLPEGERIHVVGLDVDHQTSNAARGIAMLAEGGEELPGPWGALLNRLREGDEAAVGEAADLIADNETKAQRAFGDNLDLARRVCESVDAADRYYDALNGGDEEASNEIRDGWMMASFEFACGRAPAGARFFGQFGSEHVYRAACDTPYGSKAFDRFAMRLDGEGSPVAGEVCSILYAYTSAGALPFLRAYGDSDRYLNYGPLEPWYGKDALFALDGAGSPFAEEPVFVKRGADERAPDTAYFQKLLLLSDSAETSPLE